MENLIVGNDDCKIAKIIDIVRLSPVIGQLDGKLSSLALTLETPYTLMQTIRRNTTLLGSPATESLEQMLMEWRSRVSDNAKLTTFLEALEKDDLNDFARRIRDHYRNLENSTMSSSSRAGNTYGGFSGSSGGGHWIGGASGGGDPPDGNNWRAGGDLNPPLVDREALVRVIKTHLLRSMPELIELVSWNAALVSRLQARGIIGQADVATLDAIRDLNERTRTFFTLIHQRLTPDNLDIYDQVIEAFAQVAQTGVGYVLRKGYSR